MRAAAAGALVALVLGLGACAADEPDPAQERRDRVEARLGSTFSAAQARCILERSDGDVLRALDRTADLPPDSPVLAAYSEAVAACVGDPNTTTSAPAATSEPADPGAATSTTAGG